MQALALGPLRHVVGGLRPIGPGNVQACQDPEDVLDVCVANAQVINVVNSQGDGRIERCSQASNDEEVDEGALVNLWVLRFLVGSSYFVDMAA